jgi:phosphotriesterase-related protein
MKKVRTVRGDISPDQLGFTLMHEHTLLDLSLMTERFRAMFPPAPPEKAVFKIENLGWMRSGGSMYVPECSKNNDPELYIYELNEYKKVGGNSILDCSPIEGRGNINEIKKISETTGINIVCATGMYTLASRPEELLGKGENYYRSIFEREINEGIDGTDIKPGIVKYGIQTVTESGTLDEDELAPLRAAAKVAAATGMLLVVHTSSPMTPEHVLQAAGIVLHECGVKPERLLMCHMDGSLLLGGVTLADYVLNESTGKEISLELPLKLLDQGINISLDTWGFPLSFSWGMLPDDNDRLKQLVQLLKRGYASQITVGHDMAGMLFASKHGGYGYTRFSEFAIPLLLQFGFEDAVKTITIDNPARLLPF